MNTSKENFLASAVLSVKQRFDIDISLEKLTNIVGDKMKDEWELFTYEDASPYMDTAPCEEVADLIALHYLGRRWPTYAEKGIDIHQFLRNLEEKIAA